MENTNPVKRAVAAAIKQHGSYRKAAAALGVSAPHLNRLAQDHRGASDEVLALLGLQRVVTYRKL